MDKQMMNHRTTKSTSAPIGHPGTGNASSMSYYVVMQDFGRKGREAIVDPEITRREVVSRLASGEYKNVSFIHHVTMNDVPQDVTAELLVEAGFSDAPLSPVNRQAAQFDHARDIIKHATA